MIQALWTAATGMESQQVNMDVVANNLANVNTAGFKRSRADFQDLFYKSMRNAGTTDASGNEDPVGIQVGLGAKTAAVQKIHTTGDIRQTGNDYDFAIEGNGFFQISMPNGDTAYTRAGTLKRDSTGRMVTSNGLPLYPEIVIPENTTGLSVSEDGTVNVFLDGGSEATTVGNIELANFSNVVGLKSMGKNLYAETLASGSSITGAPGQDGLGSISQGYVEGSNVSIMEEMVNMIAGQRAYEINSKAIKTADEMLSMINNLA